MSLLDYSDIQEHLNIDLTSPNGQNVATELIAAAVAWVEGEVGYSLESVEQTAYFEDGDSYFFLPTKAPVTIGPDIATYNSATSAYDAVSSDYVRSSGSGEVYVSYPLPAGFQAVKATYTAGWTSATLPKDLRTAIIELVGTKLLQIANFASTTAATSGDTTTTTTPAGGLKRVQSDSYSEEYSTAEFDAIWKAKGKQLLQTIGDDVPEGILKTINRYRRAFAI